MNICTRRILLHLLTSAMAFAGSRAFAQDEQDPIPLVGGLQADWMLERAYGEAQYAKPFLGVFAQSYARLSGRYYLRPALRASFSTAQPEMPRSLSIARNEFLGFGELGLLADGIVVPCLSIAYGFSYTRTKLSVAKGMELIADPVSGNAAQPAWRVMAGVGLPLFRGFLVLETRVLYEGIAGGAGTETRVGYGLDLSFPVL